MNSLQRTILRVGLVIVILVNIFYALGLNYVTNSAQHSVNSGAVAVYSSGEQLVPIEDYKATTGFTNTEQFVSVYLKHHYLTTISGSVAKLTLAVIAITGLGYFVAGSIKLRNNIK